jgi:tetratricopeptide (TPR) repeat protein
VPRIVLALATPILLLIVVEGGLRVAGYGFPTSLFLRSKGEQEYTSNELFLRQFYPRSTPGKLHPFAVPAGKNPGTVRIFILGESAAMGTPNPSFGFGRILEVMLRRGHPEKKFEVINAAMAGINSHIILPIARECTRHQPDLVILYLGNNEVVGLHAPGPESTWANRNLTAIRILQWIKSTKLGQLLTSLTDGSPTDEQDMEFFRRHRVARDDFRRAAVYRNFRANLESICDVVHRAGAGVVLSTVAVNLKDFPPLASLHRVNASEAETAEWESLYHRGIAAEAQGRLAEAVQNYQAAEQVDDHFAELHFRLARCYYALGRFADARRQYELARDWDALQFRADRRVNEIIREVAANRGGPGMTLVDAERIVGESALSENGIPGDKLFSEHVHLKFDGDYLMAAALYRAVISVLDKDTGNTASAPVPSRDECARELAYTPWDELQIRLAMLQVQSHPPFLDQLDHAARQSQAEQQVKQRQAEFTRQDLSQSIQIYLEAIARAPDDWQLHHNFAMLNYTVGDYAPAARHFETEVKKFPRYLTGRMILGAALARAGKTEDAITQFNEALRIDPQFAPARQSLATLTSAEWKKESLKNPSGYPTSPGNTNTTSH